MASLGSTSSTWIARYDHVRMGRGRLKPCGRIAPWSNRWDATRRRRSRAIGTSASSMFLDSGALFGNLHDSSPEPGRRPQSLQRIGSWNAILEAIENLGREAARADSESGLQRGRARPFNAAVQIANTRINAGDSRLSR